MDTFRNTHLMINDIHKLHNEELEEKDPNILSMTTIKYYHNQINNIDKDIRLRFDIYFRNNILTPEIYNHYKSIERDYRNILFNNNYYRHFLRLTSLENIDRSLTNNDYDFLKKYINNIHKKYLDILDPKNQYINSKEVNKEINSPLSLCDESLNKLRTDNNIKQLKVLLNKNQNINNNIGG